MCCKLSLKSADQKTGYNIFKNKTNNGCGLVITCINGICQHAHAIQNHSPPMQEALKEEAGD